MKANICLIGFMGSGKTTIGRALATKLGAHWVDLDEYIEEKQGLSIVTLFKEHGEAYFRKLEQLCLQEVLQEGTSIISTGGGIIVTPENRQRLSQEATFYLSYSFDTLYERIAGDLARPLVTNYKEVKERFKMRQNFYEEACWQQIDCDEKTIEEVVKEIVSKLETYPVHNL